MSLPPAATSSRHGGGAHVLTLCTRPRAEHPPRISPARNPGEGFDCLKQLSLLFSGGKLIDIFLKSLTMEEMKNSPRKNPNFKHLVSILSDLFLHHKILYFFLQ